jgi:hypothetical protein
MEIDLKDLARAVVEVLASGGDLTTYDRSLAAAITFAKRHID